MTGVIVSFDMERNNGIIKGDDRIPYRICGKDIENYFGGGLEAGEQIRFRPCEDSKGYYALDAVLI